MPVDVIFQDAWVASWLIRVATFKVWECNDLKKKKKKPY